MLFSIFLEPNLNPECPKTGNTKYQGLCQEFPVLYPGSICFIHRKMSRSDRLKDVFSIAPIPANEMKYLTLCAWLENSKMVY